MNSEIMQLIYAGVFLRLPVIIAFHLIMKFVLVKIFKYNKLVVEDKLWSLNLVFILFGILNHL